jgi:pimeloyl-ACP methyl ester carboxylesterase
MWERDMPRFIRRVFFLLLLYAILCAVIGGFVAEGALHPQRRAITPKSEASVRQIALDKQSEFQDVSIPALGKITLEAWSIDPKKSNGNAVILLHGLGDNRLGMTGYAELLLNHGYNVLLPDARSHGASGGELATYGLLERDDIRRWFEWLITNQHPHCIFGLGESMGAAQLYSRYKPKPVSVGWSRSLLFLISKRLLTTAWDNFSMRARGWAALSCVRLYPPLFTMPAGNTD